MKCAAPVVGGPIRLRRRPRFHMFRTAAAAACVALGLGLVIAPVATAGSPGRGDPRSFSWQLVESGTFSTLSGVDAVSPDVAWVGSWGGAVLRTVDGGATFADVTPAGGEDLLYPDVEASSAEDALLLGFRLDGPFRIFRTSDGGTTWTETFRADPPSFLNCMAMFDRRHGFVVGDPVDGKFQIVLTSDGGRTWELAPEGGIPSALDGEIGLFDSGSCAAATGRKAFFGTAGGAERRVFRSVDFGRTWAVSAAPIGTGILALDFRTNRLGLAAGGDMSGPSRRSLARTTDGGATWQAIDDSALPADRRTDLAWWSDLRGDQVALVPDAQQTVFAVGRAGSAVSRDRGKSWEQFDDGPFISVDCAEGSLACWAVGPTGRIAKLTVS